MGKLVKMLHHSQTLVTSAKDVLTELKNRLIDNNKFHEGYYFEARGELYGLNGIRETCDEISPLLHHQLTGQAGPLDWRRVRAIRAKAEWLVHTCGRFQRLFDIIARWSFEELEAPAQAVRLMCEQRVLDPAKRVRNLARKLQRAV